MRRLTGIPREGRFFTEFSFRVPRALTGQLQIDRTVHGIPPCLSFVGREPNKTDSEPKFLVLVEWPMPGLLMRNDRRISKRKLERLHLTGFLEQARRDGLRLPFQDPRVNPNDPPDFFVRRGPFMHGLDCVVPGNSTRRTGVDLFGRLRQAVLKESERLQHLSHTLLVVEFGYEESSDWNGGLPFNPRAGDDPVVDFVAALQHYRPRLDNLEATDPRTQSLAEEAGVSIGPGFRFYAFPWEPQLPTRFWSTAKFEMLLSMQTAITRSRASHDIERLILSHDKPGVRYLLISVAAPDRNGIRYPSESHFMNFVQEHAWPELSTSHIRSIIIHRWGNELDSDEIRILPMSEA